MGFFDRVKDVLTTSDAERARKGRDATDGSTGAAAGTDEAAAHEPTTTEAAPSGTATGGAPAPQADPSQTAGADAAPAPQAAAARPGSAVHRTHTVSRGDTLAAIAERHGVDRGALAELNHLDNPDLIYPGQVLRLPEA